MTIRELIEKLSEFDPSRRVMIDSSYGEYSADDIETIRVAEIQVWDTGIGTVQQCVILDSEKFEAP
jgi:hypothetical protein